MRIFTIIWHECRFRLGNTALGAAAIAVAVASWSGSFTLLGGHEARTAAYLEGRRQTIQESFDDMQEGMRKATLRLSFNLLIHPQGQDIKDWHAEGLLAREMPEEYADRLANSGIVTVTHFLPILQRRVWWEEKGRRVVLVGTKGEVANMHKRPRQPLVQPVPPGTIVLGHELHRSLGLKVGDEVVLMGRRFTVHRNHEPRGNVDDITAWIHLAEAQELLDMAGRIHAILALECICADMSLATFRRDVQAILPDTEVIEFGTKALARAEARVKLSQEAWQALEQEQASRQALQSARQRLAAAVVPLMLIVSLAAVAALAAANVRQRDGEFALLRALGVPSQGILVLVLLRYVMAAVPGAVAGCLAGVRGGILLAAWLDPAPLAGTAPVPSLGAAAAAVGVAVFVAAAAAWIPALIASRRDPAAVLTRV